MKPRTAGFCKTFPAKAIRKGGSPAYFVQTNSGCFRILARDSDRIDRINKIQFLKILFILS